VWVSVVRRVVTDEGGGKEACELNLKLPSYSARPSQVSTQALECKGWWKGEGMRQISAPGKR